jgi:hypothetical protein
MVWKFWDWQMLPVNDAVDCTEKDGSSFIMKDDHHRRLNKRIKIIVIIIVIICWTAGGQSRIQKLKISLRFLGIILRILRLEVSV